MRDRLRPNSALLSDASSLQLRRAHGAAKRGVRGHTTLVRAIAALMLLAPLAVLADCEAERALRLVVARDPTKLANDAVERHDLGSWVSLAIQ